MIRVVVGAAEAVVDDRTLVVRIAAAGAIAHHDEATITVAIADPDLSRAMTAGIAAAMSGGGEPPADHRAVRVRSRQALARRAASVPGAIAIVPVTVRNAKYLLEIVDGIRAAGAIGVQLVWNGADRARIERRVFAVLERARATPNDPPVVLATSDRPIAALRILVAHRSRKDTP